MPGNLLIYPQPRVLGCFSELGRQGDLCLSWRPPLLRRFICAVCVHFYFLKNRQLKCLSFLRYCRYTCYFCFFKKGFSENWQSTVSFKSFLLCEEIVLLKCAWKGVLWIKFDMVMSFCTRQT